MGCKTGEKMRQIGRVDERYICLCAVEILLIRYDNSSESLQDFPSEVRLIKRI